MTLYYDIMESPVGPLRLVATHTNDQVEAARRHSGYLRGGIR